jgi:hypothetical protein
MCANAIDGFYTATAELLGCQPENVAFATNATDAFSRALSSIPFERSDVILTTRDDYISNQIAFLSLQKRFGVEIVHAPTFAEGGVDVDAMARLMQERRPRVVVPTHIPTNSGLVQPVAEIGRHCRELELLLRRRRMPVSRTAPGRRRYDRLRLPVCHRPEVPARAARHGLPLRLRSCTRCWVRAALRRHARRALD